MYMRDIQYDRYTWEIHNETDKQWDRYTMRQIYNETDIQWDRYTMRQIYNEKDIQWDRYTWEIYNEIDL